MATRSTAVRYPVADIVAYEQKSRQGMPNDTALPPKLCVHRNGSAFQDKT